MHKFLEHCEMAIFLFLFFLIDLVDQKWHLKWEDLLFMWSDNNHYTLLKFEF